MFIVLNILSQICNAEIRMLYSMIDYKYVY